jgi:acylphosphatase
LKTVKRLIVTGLVQGVGYRASMVYAARRLGITGWVKNRRNGAVEAVAQGSPDALKEFIEWAWKGPGLAEVESVEVLEANGDFGEFSIADTE